MKRKWTLIALAVLLLSLVSAPGALAARNGPPGGRGRLIRGQVVAVTGHTLTVATPRGRVHVVTSENTVFRVPGVEDASIEDFSQGDTIVAVGWWSGDGADGSRPFHARLLALVPARVHPARVRGQVTAIEGSDVTVATGSGASVVVRTDADTAFRVPGLEEPGLGDVRVGDRLWAAGVWNDDGSLQAKAVVLPRQTGRRARLVGEIAAVEGTTLTLRTSTGQEIVLSTDGETAFVVPGVEHATLADVSVGDRLAAEVLTQEGALYAKTVAVLPEEATRVAGRVSRIEGTDLVLETRRGTVRVLTGSDTLIRIPGVENPTLADVALGDVAICGGSWENEATFSALAIVVRRPEQGAVRRRAIVGKVTSVGSDRLTVETFRGPITVLVTEETVIRVRGVESPTLADIEKGNGVAVRGDWHENGALEADAILALKRAASR